jgi:hypothetical protein
VWDRLRSWHGGVNKSPDGVRIHGTFSFNFETNLLAMKLNLVSFAVAAVAALGLVLLGSGCMSHQPCDAYQNTEAPAELAD